jgi:tetratricopeptide (TPR) repeat protein
LRRTIGLLVGLLLLAASAHSGSTLEIQPLGGLRAEVAALLIQGIGGGGLPIAVAIFPEVTYGAVTPGGLAFLVELGSAPVMPVEGERPLEVYVYAVDPGGEVVAHYAATAPSWPAVGEGVKVAGRLPLGAGAYSLRFLVWDPAGRRYGMAVREVVLEATSAAPRIADDCADWSVADDAPGDLPRLSARPVLVRGERLRLSLGRMELPAGEAWRVRFTRAGEDEATELESEAVVVEPQALEVLVPDLPQGVYDLSVTSAGAKGWSSLPLESWLVSTLPPAGAGCRRSWGRVLRLARSDRLAASTERSRATGSRPGQRTVSGYRAVLEELVATGSLKSAARGLAELELSAAERDLTKTSHLFAAELRAVRSLLAADSRCLIPLVGLHAETYRVHHAAGRFPLATHSRRLAAAVADLAAELATAPEERVLVAVAITALADMVETHRASVEAQQLLERALALDDTQEAALLLLAVSYERKGRYLDARRQLEALVSANSAHHEGRVRLAILLGRTGQPEEAERLLQAVVAERPPPWLLSLAYQSLARLLIREGRLAEATARLERARIRLPEDQAVHLLLAYALDRGGDRRRASSLLAGLPPAVAAVSPRYRYSDEPAAALGLLHETLRQSITVRLPVLAVALGVERSGGPAP